MGDGVAPSRGWYVLAAILVFAAAAVAGVATVWSINSVQLTRAQLPGSMQFDVEHSAGDWVVFIEGDGPGIPKNPGLDIQFTSPDGASVELMASSMDLFYTMGSTAGQSIGMVRIDRYGTWTISGRWPDGASAERGPFRYAFGPNPAETALMPILIGGSIAVALFALGLGTWGLVLWMRFKAHRAGGTLSTESG